MRLLRLMMMNLVCAALCVGSSARGQLPDKPLVLAVNDGVSYRALVSEQREKYAPIVADIERLTGKKVVLEIVDRYDKLSAGLKDGSYALAYIHPTHVASAAVSEHHYRLIATSAAHQNYRAAFLIGKGEPVKTPKELWSRYVGNVDWMAGKPVGAPDESSITAVVARATLRDGALEAGFKFGNENHPRIKYSRYQDSIPSMIDYGFSNIAVSASRQVIDEWTAAKKPIAFSSRPVPIKLWIGSKDLGEIETAKVRAYLIGLRDAKGGADKLRSISLPQGFVGYDEQELLRIDRWLRG